AGGRRPLPARRGRSRRAPGTAGGNVRPARRVIVLGLAGLAALTGCGTVPAMPGELPTDFVPAVEAPHVADPGSLSADGVDAAGLQVSTYGGGEIGAVPAGVADVAALPLLRTAEPLPLVPGLAEVDAAVGEDVTVVGYPRGGQLTTASGSMLGYELDTLGSGLGMVGRTNAQVDHGSSGSAVLGSDGQVVGVVYAMDAMGNSYMVPVSTLHDLLAEEAFEPITSCRDVPEGSD